METTRFRQDVQKYMNYFFERKGFTTDLAMGAISPVAVQTAGHIRGVNRPPALMIQAIMPRSGSVYVGELLRRHPDLHGNPHGLFEMPTLQLAPHIRQLQQQFMAGYRLNAGKIGTDDFLPIVGASLIAYLHEDVPPQQRALTKMPNVQYLNHFFTTFPHENVLVLVRDGRDVVHSTLRTWKHTNFMQICLRWNRSAIAIHNSVNHWQTIQQKGYWLAKFEDALHQPEQFINEACHRFNLDAGRYPFEQIADIRVIGSSKLAQQQEKVTWKTHFDKPKDFSPTAYWQGWSGLRKKIFKVIAGQSLINLGYCEDLDW